MSLTAYTRKRDFHRTKEPSGKGRKTRSKGDRFVIQKHDASRLHYDFRLEIDGTLKSWAVPKGIPYKKGEKHLAVHVEDHPLDYAGFEGTIPEGQYGGGTVMVWDTGTFEPVGENAKKDYAAGKLQFRLHGEKLEGEWTLLRMRGSGGKEQWLLLKSGEDVRPITKKRDDESALTGRSMKKIAAGEEEKPRKAAPPKRKLVRAAAKRPSTPLRFIPAMKATLREEPPTEGDWSYELKFDGFRALALKNGNSVELFSLNGKDFKGRFPEIAEAIAELPEEQLALDGEIVALDDVGRSSFELLQGHGNQAAPIAFYAFDLLQRNGEELLQRPLRARRAALEEVMRDASEPLRFSAEVGGDPNRLLEEVCRRGLEGVIGKRTDSIYEPGNRSRSWIKLKCLGQQEFVIGGYTPPEGARKHFGALLVGYYEGDSFRFAGKVGTGFNEALLKSLHQRMEGLRKETCLFANLPEKTAGKWSQNITSAEMRRCKWVEPKIVCQLKFTEWTRDGKLRHPVFLGVREDKRAREVVRERPAKS